MSSVCVSTPGTREARMVLGVLAIVGFVLFALQRSAVGPEVALFPPFVEQLEINQLSSKARFLTPPGIDDRIDDWVAGMLTSTSSLLDINTAGTTVGSSVTVLEYKQSYIKGESLRMRVDIRDGYGRQLTRGGDDIRVTLEGSDAALAGHVTDLGNGSYLAVLPLLWTGQAEVKVQLQKNVELYRVFYHAQSVLKTLGPLSGVFSKGRILKTSVCSSFPNISAYNNMPVCDLSSNNGGLDWFCAQPKHTNLSCDDLLRIKGKFSHAGFLPMPSSLAEKALIQRYIESSVRSIAKSMIPNKITINIQQETTIHNVSSTRRPLSQHSIRQSWSDDIPKGFFKAKKWYSRSGERNELSQKQLLSAFRNTTLMFLGDSNLRLMFKIIARRSGCNISTGVVQPKWHHPLDCVHQKAGFHMDLRFHGLPFHSVGVDIINDSRPPHVLMDEIPSAGRFVVCVHLYPHFAFHHHSVFTQHLQAVRDSMERVMSRNPSVQFVLRGPHTVVDHLDGGDMAVRLFSVIIKQVFIGLYDRVIYLQPWDMTLAVHSMLVHPEDFVNEAIVDEFLSLLKKYNAISY